MGTPGAAAGRSIMVVEDNADSLRMLCMALQLQGYLCFPAEGGRAALKLLEGVRPDVAIVDLEMPGISGFDVAMRVRELFGAEVRLIALTGHADKQVRRAAREAGFDYHVLKPVSTEQLRPYIEDQIAPDD